jgi:hypothetical protein
MRILTEDHFAAIPGLIAGGWNAQRIANEWGVKKSTLVVQCSRRKISLRPLVNSRKRELPSVPRKHIRAAKAVVEAYEQRARARGQSGVEFISELLSIIVRDNLIDAVLDEREAA